MGGRVSIGKKFYAVIQFGYRKGIEMFHKLFRRVLKCCLRRSERLQKRLVSIPAKWIRPT
jgi:hypothetical protein